MRLDILRQPVKNELRNALFVCSVPSGRACWNTVGGLPWGRDVIIFNEIAPNTGRIKGNVRHESMAVIGYFYLCIYGAGGR